MAWGRRHLGFFRFAEKKGLSVIYIDAPRLDRGVQKNIMMDPHLHGDEIAEKIMHTNVLEELENYDWNKVINFPKKDSDIKDQVIN